MRLPRQVPWPILASSLCLLFALLIATAFWSGRKSDEAVNRTGRALQLSVAYDETLLKAWSLHAAEQLHRDPSTANLTAVNDATRAVLNSLEEINFYGDAADHSLTASFERLLLPPLERDQNSPDGAEPPAFLPTLDTGAAILAALMPIQEAHHEDAARFLKEQERTRQHSRWLSLSANALALGLVSWLSYGIHLALRVQRLRMGELQQDALTDGLTELNNQRAFDTEFRREVAPRIALRGAALPRTHRYRSIQGRKRHLGPSGRRYNLESVRLPSFGGP